MKPVIVIAKNTYREIIRDRVLYILVVFALVLIGVSLALGQLTFAEQVRISANFGLAAIQISSVVLAIFVGSTLVSKEIDKKTIMTLLARPVSRTQFLMGKSLGLIGVIATVILGLVTVLSIIFSLMGLDLSLNFMFALHGIFLEALTLLAFSILFSTFASPMMVVSFGVGIFLIGHWINSLSFFVGKAAQSSWVTIGKWVTYIFPNLEVFNWRAVVIYGEDLPLSEVLSATGYMALWFAFLFASSALIFRRKDFG